jgi:hypothetical protein
MSAELEPAAAILADPYPCEHCAQAHACAMQLLACAAFKAYVAGAGERRWSATARSATRETWEALFAPGVPRARAAEQRLQIRAARQIRARKRAAAAARGLTAKQRRERHRIEVQRWRERRRVAPIMLPSARIP